MVVCLEVAVAEVGYNRTPSLSTAGPLTSSVGESIGAPTEVSTEGVSPSGGHFDK